MLLRGMKLEEHRGLICVKKMLDLVMGHFSWVLSG